MPETDFVIIPARERDFPAIKKLIRQVGINPIGLDWRRFIAAVDEDDRLIGCGQLKTHSDGTIELASIALCQEWRKKGVARALIECLLTKHSPPIYLMCQGDLRSFYEKFGFRIVETDEMGRYFRRIAHLLAGLRMLRLFRDQILIMKYG